MTEDDLKITERLVRGGKGRIQHCWVGPQISCKRYLGKFVTQDLQDRADLGLWFVRISGHPVLEGSGRTIQAAVFDAITRNRARIKQLQRGVEILEAQLPLFEKEDP